MSDKVEVVAINKDRLAQVEFVQTKNPIIYDSHKIYWGWDEDLRYYKQIDITDVLNIVKKWTADRTIITARSKPDVITAIQSTGRLIDVDPVPLNYIQFKNCVIDINTGDINQAEPDYFWTNPIPHNFGSCSDTPTIDKLFIDWVGKKNQINLYEMLAYSLYRDYPIHKIFTLVGNGRNGKGQYIKIVEKLIGLNNIFSTNFENLTHSRFETAGLRNKLVTLISETDGSKLKGTSTLKAISGNDLNRYEIKGSSNRDDEFRSYATIYISTNNIPDSDDESDGFYDRWFIEDFPYQFKTGIDIINTIPEIEYENLGYKLIRILKELLNRGQFTNQGTIQNNKDKYKKLSNPTNEFISKKCIISNDLVMTTKEFYNLFDTWCVMNRLTKLTPKKINKEIRNLGFEIKQTTDKSVTTRRIFGLGYDYNHLTVCCDDMINPFDVAMENEYNGF